MTHPGGSISRASGLPSEPWLRKLLRRLKREPPEWGGTCLKNCYFKAGVCQSCGYRLGGGSE